MTKKIDSGRTLNDKILNGVNVLADAVSTTLGPRGRNVILKQKNQKPLITKDGVTVAKAVVLKDPFENAAAQIIKQAAEETATDAGDGTTTSTVLARAILQQAQGAISAGASPVELKRGIDLAVSAIVEKLKDQARPIKTVTDIEKIATVSANGDEGIGKLIATAVDQVGKDGSITIEDGHSNETSLDVYEGFRFDSGLLADKLVTDLRRAVMRYEDAIVLVTDLEVSRIDELLPILEQAARAGKPFIIIAESIEGQALAAIIMNHLNGNMKVSAIKAPRYGEERRTILEDLALTIGARFVSRANGDKLEGVKLSDLGEARIIESNKYMTTVVAKADPQAEQAIETRLEGLRAQIKDAPMAEAQRLQERITRLASSVAVIRVGAATQVEQVEKKHRIEDALEAVNSAQQEGMMPGGGVALITASNSISIKTDNDDQSRGVQIVLNACEAPFRRMCENAGLSADVNLDRLLRGRVMSDLQYRGIDITTDEEVDMFIAGIIDPAKVTRCALENAASAASTLLTTGFAIIETED